VVDWGEEGSLKIFCAVLARSRIPFASRPTADVPRPSRCSPNDKGASARSIRDANDEVGGCDRDGSRDGGADVAIRRGG
jgi:hypothetical protein